eukprot:gene15068-17834_t
MGAITLMGGVMGYYKAKSLPSLIAGSAFAVLYTASGLLIERDPQQGHALSTVVSTALAFAMGKRAIKTQKIMPGGIVATAGALSAVYNGKKLYDYTYGV